ncbi:ERF family protein [Phaeobacter gallaeciensis]|uniref:ERF superfamily protein n=1 Tax=Phaeobacter gallaeciensis TaxID=60890 RepID=A0AAC9ZA87_9RHOB|nr:ERF family protein [Phaeobacter gallaeciensis]AHD10035.1 ERF superfamily [Phaeobacter gallaeciensis DSM 26640]ATE93299.1 ERF superfamily protein [Phaeobacter gallaeciensis]ATE96880.1 ERF superfamily protein [Phaeobacter gallaeciensis]ATF01963.1 ERF superfamily protein [Phaeobacter gallaeciensis]ATF06343.1 ERF superfamily protein [Phaeobacter gallaeciensis]
MTKHEAIPALDTAVGHKSIASALSAAQMEMGKALKQANNPHFRSKYADLGNVMDACLPALNKNGIAVVQPTTDDDTGRYVKTILIHGETGETLECRVPLIVSKNDMQGYGSAVTYARRYGLMAMAGIAPEDDDGNAAAKAAPQVQTVSAGQYTKLRDLAQAAGVTEQDICAKVGAPSLEQFPANRFDAVAKGLQSKIDAANPSPAEQITGDEIPHKEPPHAP